MPDVLLIESDRILASNTQKALKRAGNGVEWYVDPQVGSSRVDLQACKLEYSIVSPK